MCTIQMMSRDEFAVTVCVCLQLIILELFWTVPALNMTTLTPTS